MHSFDSTDGAYPFAGLIQATNGSFYGTTNGGGANGYGTIFKITPAGTLTTLHSFDSTDGSGPYASLVQGTDGNFYGTTYQGGANNYGTIFRIAPAGKLTTLHSFDSTDGATPEGTLAQGTDGDFYGTTVAGGTNDDGTVFKLSVGLGPFVKTVPDFGKVGEVITILGTNLTGTTNVSFNGTVAAYTNVSATEITATVPSAATTGTVQVVTPSDTLSSNVLFRVLP